MSYWKRYVFSRLGGVLLVGLGLSAMDWEHDPRVKDWPILPHLAPKVGEAFLIAWLLAVVVDKAAKEELLQEFAEAVSAKIKGRLLPEKLRQVIEGHLDETLIRQGWTIRYKIETIPGHPVLFLQETEVEYIIENRSALTQNYEHAFGVKYEEIEGFAPTSISKLGYTGPDGNKDLSLEQLRALQPNGRKWLNASITISLPPASTARCCASSSEYIYVNDETERITARYPCTDTTIVADYPPEKISMTVTISSTGKELSSEPLPPRGLKWVMDAPILPGQYLSITRSTIHG